eukprot:CAMPEP_0202814960 /NCGR_PEP_ID=MMETSP1389-20130828/5946_1 /ASSEMBLY_ACC=CAM_ASM_000865 /TAXON_ID=302021 /ORGANISM="Rhodomonas sp., Strain CCMP768" /LENGTH=215 /DNA_ID=CAMNT_0049486831 /DNA_START=71 /DNA_END=718 /DNA_ORIENTATION=+
MTFQTRIHMSVMGADALLLAVGLLLVAPANGFLSLAPLSLRPSTCATAGNAPVLVTNRPPPVASTIFMLAKSKAKDDVPKRPLTAYFRFSMEQRPILKKSNPELSNQDVLKKMGEMWRELSAAQKKPFQDAAAKELDAWNALYGKKAQPEKPKKPLSAYMLYSNHVRPAVKDANPAAKFGDIAKIIGKQWREMGAAEKAKWVQMEAKNKEAAKTK